MFSAIVIPENAPERFPIDPIEVVHKAQGDVGIACRRNFSRLLARFFWVRHRGLLSFL